MSRNKYGANVSPALADGFIRQKVLKEKGATLYFLNSLLGARFPSLPEFNDFVALDCELPKEPTGSKNSRVDALLSLRNDEKEIAKVIIEVQNQYDAKHFMRFLHYFVLVANQNITNKTGRAPGKPFDYSENPLPYMVILYRGRDKPSKNPTKTKDHCNGCTIIQKITINKCNHNLKVREMRSPADHPNGKNYEIPWTDVELTRIIELNLDQISSKKPSDLPEECYNFLFLLCDPKEFKRKVSNCPPELKILQESIEMIHPSENAFSPQYGQSLSKREQKEMDLIIRTQAHSLTNWFFKLHKDIEDYQCKVRSEGGKEEYLNVIFSTLGYEGHGWENIDEIDRPKTVTALIFSLYYREVKIPAWASPRATITPNDTSDDMLEKVRLLFGEVCLEDIERARDFISNNNMGNRNTQHSTDAPGTSNFSQDPGTSNSFEAPGTSHTSRRRTADSHSHSELVHVVVPDVSEKKRSRKNFNAKQILQLEECFDHTKTIKMYNIDQIAANIGEPSNKKRVINWLQNRRQKWRKEEEAVDSS